MRRLVIILVSSLTLLLVNCSPTPEEEKTVPTQGIWRATLSIAEGVKLPFNFRVNTQAGQPLVAIINGMDTLVVTEMMMKEDSLILQLPVYHAEIRAQVSDSAMSGRFHNYYRGSDYTIPFTAVHGVTYRFRPGSQPTTDLSGRWEVWFGTDSTDLDQAVGLFEQQGPQVTGTFLTPYGDYRFLDGQATRDSLLLSAFDGMHVMYFGASLGDTLHGIYRSGNHFAEPWKAWRNDTLALPDAFRLASAISPFSVNLGEVKPILDNSKPTVIQIMGTWCPNCKDEARVLEQYYQAHGDQMNVIGLSFERTRDDAQALTNIDRTTNYLSLTYPVFYAGYADRDGVTAVLPDLEGFTAYPTTIFLYGDEKVAAVHTGFSGPATGRAYEETLVAYDELIDQLLAY